MAGTIVQTKREGGFELVKAERGLWGIKWRGEESIPHAQ